MARADLRDVSIFYDTAGDHGAPVLLVMGFTMRGRVWRFQIPDLSAHHRVCWYDHRGCGESDAPEPPYTMEQLAADAVALMDHLGWQDAHIVGVSMGGMVAQHLALDHRERARSLTLIATTPGGPWGPFPTIRGLGSMLRVGMGGRRGGTLGLLFPKAFRKEVGPDWLDEVLEHDFAPAVPKAGRRGQFKAIRRHDTRPRLAELEGLPTLIIQPGKDRLIRPRQSARLHALIPGSTLLTVPAAGHGLVRQAGAIINPAMLEHFAAADAARPAARPARAVVRTYAKDGLG